MAKNVAPGAKVTGAPARDFMTMRRMDASLTHLPDLLKLVKALAARIETLEHQQ